MSFTGTAAGIGTVTSGTNVGANMSSPATAGAITTVSGNYIFASGGWGSGSGGTAGTGFTRTYLLNGSDATAGDDILGEYALSTGAAITPTFSWGTDDAWGIVAVEIKAASGGGSVKFR